MPEVPAASSPRPRPRQGRSMNLDRQMSKVRFSACGEYLVAGGFDATERRWRVTAPALEPFPSLEGHNGWVQALAFHPHRKRLVTGDSWGGLRIWNYADREA